MDRKGIVADFLQRCIDYSNASITRKQERGDIEEIESWKTYQEFTKHALMEIHTGKLDSWFESQKPTELKQPRRIDVLDLEHRERATWLSGILSPRPLVLVSTKNAEGLGNLAPLTSAMAVSTKPPLMIASLSQGKNDRQRDTMNNLRETKKAILHMMPSTLQAVDWVDNAGSPIPPSESEWDLTGLEASEDEPMLVKQAVAAIEVEYLEEVKLPDAVAKLVVLKVTHIWTSLDQAPLSGLDILCQHGLDRLTPSPENWGKTIDKHYG